MDSLQYIPMPSFFFFWERTLRSLVFSFLFSIFLRSIFIGRSDMIAALKTRAVKRTPGDDGAAWMETPRGPRKGGDCSAWFEWRATLFWGLSFGFLSITLSVGLIHYGLHYINGAFILNAKLRTTLGPLSSLLIQVESTAAQTRE